MPPRNMHSGASAEVVENTGRASGARPGLLGLGMILLWPIMAMAQVSPEESAKMLKPAEGLEATLWASEPMVVNPTTMDIDSRGRVWVTEGLNYRLTRGGNRQFKRIEDADKIKILEDTDGDGKADKMTVFADKVFPVPMGIAVEEFWSKEGKYKGCKVYVGNSPDLLVLEDSDGDDKADKRYALLTGFGGIDSDHGVHGMVLGIDGKLYFTHGDGCCSVQQDHSERQQNFDVTDKSGRRVSSDQLANTLRSNRDGTQFEIIADRQRNNYETCMNSFGNMFTSDNDDDGNRGSRVIWVMDGGHYGYRTPGSPRHWGEDVPGNVPKLVGTGNGSPCGVMVYEGELLPKEYFGAVLEAEAGPRVINYFPLTRKGAAFRTEHKIMLSSDDPWFRPVDVTAAPDGSVFVADWYDGGVGGHAFRDQTTGRIYRLAPRGVKTKKVAYDFATAEGLSAAFASPNIAARDVACRLLVERGPNDALAGRAMDAAAKTVKDHLRARILWLLDQFEDRSLVASLAEGMLRQDMGFRAMSGPLRELSVRVLGRDVSSVGHVEGPVSKAPNPKRVRTLLAAVNDPDAGVRRELILAFRDMPTKDVGEALKKLAESWDGQDRWYLEALGLALRHREPDFLKELFEGDLYGDLNLKEFGEATNVALPPYFPVDRNEAYLGPNDALPPANALSKTLGLMWEIHRIEALPLLAKVMPTLKTPALQQAADDVIQHISDPAGASFLVEQAKAANDRARTKQILATLSRKLEGDWRSAAATPPVVQLVKSAVGDPELKLQGIELAGATGDANHGELLAHEAKSSNNSEEARVAAVEALAKVHAPRSRETLEGFIADALSKKSSTPIAEAAVRSLQRLGERPERFEQLMLNVDAPAGLRRQALRLVVSTEAGARRVLAAIGDKSLPEDLKTDAATLLRVHPDGKIRGEIANVLPITTRDKKPLPPFYDIVRGEGNVERGRDVFFNAGTTKCGSCHRVQGRGQWVGPDLSTVGAKDARPQLLRSILNPSEAVSFNFRATVLALTDGRVITGLLVEESPSALVVKTAEGKRERVPLAEVEERKFSELSLMPDGLVGELSAAELVDLLEYLASLKQPVSIVGQFSVAGPITGAAPTEGDLAEPYKPSDRARGNGNEPIAWKRANANAEGLVDLGKTGAGLYKLHTSVTSPVEQKVRLAIDAADVVSVWLNGKRLTSPTPERGPLSLEITLPEGTSDLNLETIANPKSSPGIVVTFVSERTLDFAGATEK